MVTLISPNAASHFRAQDLNSGPWGREVTRETMYVARWQNSCASVFRSRGSLVRTFVASSIVADSLRSEPEERRQVARPAVELRVLLQRSCTPPVAAVARDMAPEQTAVSSSARKVAAREDLASSKALRSAISARDLRGDEAGALLRDGDEGGVVSSTGRKRSLLGDGFGLVGEYVSFHSLVRAASQKESRDGRPGGVGMRNFFLVGDCRRDFVGD